MKKLYKRRKIIVNEQFQWKYTATVLFTVLFAVGVTALSISWFHLFLTDERIVCDANGKVMIILMSLTVGLIFFVIARTLHFTHTIAGPVHKVGLVLNRAARFQFDSEPLQFRKGDSFVQLQQSVNNCITAFRKIQSTQGTIQDRITQLQSKIDSQNLSRAEIVQELRDINNVINGASDK